MGSIDTVSFQRTTREGLHSITQLQLAPSIEHQIAAMFSILVRCFDIRYHNYCQPVCQYWLFICLQKLNIWYLTMQTLQGVPIWNYLKGARALICFDFIRSFFWNTLYFFENIVLATSSRYPIPHSVFGRGGTRLPCECDYLPKYSSLWRLSIDNRHKRECSAVDCAAKCHL